MAHTFKISLFTDVKAQSVLVKTVDLYECADLHSNTWSANKDSQPSWNLGLFGPDRSAAGCLRHAANHRLATGIMVDNDDGLALDEIQTRLDARGLMYMQYSTASHGLPGKGNRSRIVFPLAKDHLPSECGLYVSRINGLVGGILARESWVPSTGWKYTNITGLPPSEVYVSPGEECIDEADDLDATAMPYQARAGQAAGGGAGGTLDFDSMTDTELQDVILLGEHGYRPASALASLFEEQGVTEADAVANLTALFDAIPVGARRAKKWTQQRARIPTWVAQVYARAVKRRSKPFSAMVTYLESGPFKDAVRFNSFARRVEVVSPFPPAPGQTLSGHGVAPLVYRALSDPEDTLECLIHLQANGFPKASKAGVFDALYVAGSRHRVHPVQDYLNGLKWDGVARINNVFVDYIPGFMPEGEGEEDKKRARRFFTYLERIGACFMISAVARIFQPGCKHDHMVVLISPQGRNKSKALAAFVPDPSWFSDDVPSNVSDKDAKLALDGKWLIELAELPHLRKEIDKVKAFLSRATDRYRLPYGRLVQDWARQNVFIGTTNELELPDYTGNRRFWPMPVDGVINDELITRDRDQLWAEAVHRYRAGERWWLSAEVEKIAREIQSEYVEADVRDQSIMEWIAIAFPSGKDIKFTVRDVLERGLGFVIDPQDRVADSTRPLATVAEEKRVQRRLRVLGYHPEPHQTRQDGKRYRFWVPVPMEPDET